MRRLAGDPIFATWAAIALGSFVTALLLALLVFPLRARRRFRQAGKPVPTWPAVQGVFLWPPICALILLFLLCIAFTALPREVVRSVEAADAASPVLGWLVFAGVVTLTCLLTWLLMGLSARKHLALGYRNVWLPALLLMVMALATVAGLQVALNRARGLAKRSIDMTNLRQIHTSLVLYHGDHEVYPPTLRLLVDAKHLSPRQLISLWSGYDLQLFEGSTPYAGPCEVGYLPQAMDHADLIVIWFDPKYHNGEDAYVVYGDGRFQDLKPEQFAAELARTRQWLRDHPRPPASQPASGPATLPASGSSVERE